MDFPSYDQLTSAQQELLDTLGDGKTIFDSHLDDKQKACFLNITCALAWIGIRTRGLRLNPLEFSQGDRGIQQDRLIFGPWGIDDLRKQLDDRIKNRNRYGDRGFQKDRPLAREHTGMAKWGGRQWVSFASLQIGGGPAGAFIDIDEYGAKTDVVGFFGHLFEVVRNKTKHVKTDPFVIGRRLSQRFKLPYTFA